MTYLHIQDLWRDKRVFLRLVFCFFCFFYSCKSTKIINKRTKDLCEPVDAQKLLELGDFELLRIVAADPNKTFLSSKVSAQTGSSLQEPRQCSKILKLDLDFSKAENVDFVLYRFCDQKKQCIPSQKFLNSNEELLTDETKEVFNKHFLKEDTDEGEIFWYKVYAADADNIGLWSDDNLWASETLIEAQRKECLYDEDSAYSSYHCSQSYTSTHIYQKEAQSECYNLDELKKAYTQKHISLSTFSKVVKENVYNKALDFLENINTKDVSTFDPLTKKSYLIAENIKRLGPITLNFIAQSESTRALSTKLSEVSENKKQQRVLYEALKQKKSDPSLSLADETKSNLLEISKEVDELCEDEEDHKKQKKVVDNPDDDPKNKKDPKNKEDPKNKKDSSTQETDLSNLPGSDTDSSSQNNQEKSTNNKNKQNTTFLTLGILSLTIGTAGFAYFGTRKWQQAFRQGGDYNKVRKELNALFKDKRNISGLSDSELFKIRQKIIQHTNLMNQSYFKTETTKINIDSSKESILKTTASEKSMTDFLKNPENKIILSDFGVTVDGSGKIITQAAPKRPTGFWESRQFNFEPNNPLRTTEKIVANRLVVANIDDFGRVSTLGDMDAKSLTYKIDRNFLGSSLDTGKKKVQQININDLKNKAFIQIHADDVIDSTDIKYLRLAEGEGLETKYLYLYQLETDDLAQIRSTKYGALIESDLSTSLKSKISFGGTLQTDSKSIRGTSHWEYESYFDAYLSNTKHGMKVLGAVTALAAFAGITFIVYSQFFSLTQNKIEGFFDHLKKAYKDFDSLQKKSQKDSESLQKCYHFSCSISN